MNCIYCFLNPIWLVNNWVVAFLGVLFGRIMWFSELGYTGLVLCKFRLYSRDRLNIHFSYPALQNDNNDDAHWFFCTAL